MFERLRFIRYAVRFERAFRSDVWGPVEACFAAGATYTVAGSGTVWDGTWRGPRDIVTQLKRMLDAIDRRYDRRSARPAGWWRVEAGTLVIPWRAVYTLGAERVDLRGVSRCRFDGGTIVELSDTMPSPEVCRRWGSLVGAL